MNRHPFSFLLALALPLAGIAFTAAPAFAQTPPPAAAAAPVTAEGRVARFVLTPRGNVAAIVLQDTTVVPVAPNAPEVAALKPGAVVHVEGKLHQTPTGNVITHAVVQHQGKVISDGSKARRHGKHHGEGRKHRHARGEKQQLAPLSVTAKVAQVLASPRGKVHTVLLDDGTTATGFGLETLGLKSGDRITVNGQGGAYPLGKALHIETITLPNGETRTLPRPAPRQHRQKGQQQQPV